MGVSYDENVTNVHDNIHICDVIRNTKIYSGAKRN